MITILRVWFSADAAAGGTDERKTTRNMYGGAQLMHNGKDACAAKQIPEDILYALAKDINGDIERVTILPNNEVRFVLSDETEILKHRMQPSRAESWTDEMKLEASRASKERSRNYADRNSHWEFVKVYTDEGISGTNTKKREGFNSMIADAVNGKIDLIITKSVSRFARNTVDSLVTIRKLKEHNVEVYFEKENIYTFDGKGELLLTIMSSLAQEESRSISQNVTRGQRKRFADGKISLPYKHFLGYEKGEDGIPKIVPERAEIVRTIYRQYMLGKSITAICRYLESKGIKTPAGKEKWRESTVFSILQNEKCKGDALLQKEFTVDFLQKKKKKNEGEIPQYYVDGSHEPIIPPRDFDLVQAEIKRRSELGRKYSASSIFSTKLICGDCGGYYGSKVWHSTDRYRKTIWQCNKKFKKERKCTTPTLDEKIIKEKFLKALNMSLENKDEIIENCKISIAVVSDTAEIDKKLEKLSKELETTALSVSEYVNKNASETLSQDEYINEYTKLTKKYEKKAKQREKLISEKEDKFRRADEIRRYVQKMIETQNLVTEWDDTLWVIFLDSAIVNTDGTMGFCFKDGSKIPVRKTDKATADILA